MEQVYNGIDILLQNPPGWKNERIGFVTNDAATTSNFESSRVALIRTGFNVVTLFSPEHGIDTTGPDGHQMRNATDSLTGLPVASLYGSQLAPSHEQLANIDRIIFDIPDIGSRFYTYLWTLTHVMEACAATGRPLTVLDRPNPLSGKMELAEGPILNEELCGSFIGRWSLPVRHSCTLGELTNYFNVEKGIRANAEVINCQGWNRNLFPDGGVSSFVPKSPAMPSFESALLYPGLCFLEATNLSEGRGTPVPFRVAAATWLDARVTAAMFNDVMSGQFHNNRGQMPVVARPVQLRPSEGKFAGEQCRGVMLHVADPEAFAAVHAGWLLIRIIKQIHPHHFEWSAYPTFVNPTGRRHLDLLSGIPNTEKIFDMSLEAFVAEMPAMLSTENWKTKILPFLTY